MKPATSEPGSYRDREGRVFYVGDDVYRALSQHAWDQWRALRETRFFADLCERGQVVATREANHPVPLPREVSPTPPVGVLHHDRIPFVSYPYEWTFHMLKEAAGLHLEILDRALQEGFVLKDSSAYNVQFRGASPTFIDVSSFERWEEGEPWVGYLQFCQLFLYPLLLTAYRDVPFQPLLRGRLDGIDPEVAASLFSLRDRFRAGVFAHVYLQARLQRAHADRTDSVRAEVKRFGFSKQLIQNNVRSLRRLVGSLEWKRARSEWSEYGQTHSYGEDDHRVKEDLVRRAAERSAGELLWDLGCNTGHFSLLAAPSFRSTVAMDADQLAVDRLFLRLRKEGRTDVLPLVNNLVDPSPDLGWRGRERRSLPERGKPRLVLALALIHHLVIGANVPLEELLDWLAELQSDLVIEWVDRDDPMVKKLLLNKRDHYADYDRELLERRLEERWQVADRREVLGGRRVLYYARYPR